jgi:hypothetical protein
MSVTNKIDLLGNLTGKSIAKVESFGMMALFPYHPTLIRRIHVECTGGEMIRPNAYIMVMHDICQKISTVYR